MSRSVTEPLVGADRVAPRVAQPLPLGFLGLAVASFSFATVQLGWIGFAQGATVALATGMAVLAGTWAAIALTTYTSPPGSTSKGLGVVLVSTGAAMLVPAGAALAQPWAAAVMAGAAARFWVTAGYELTGDKGWEHAAGWVGLAVAALGFCVALLVATGVVGDDAR